MKIRTVLPEPVGQRVKFFASSAENKPRGLSASPFHSYVIVLTASLTISPDLITR